MVVSCSTSIHKKELEIPSLRRGVMSTNPKAELATLREALRVEEEAHEATRKERDMCAKEYRRILDQWREAEDNPSVLQARLSRAEALLSKWVKAYDEADERGIMSDHGDCDADLEKCPGCRMDVISEDAREFASYRAQDESKEGA